MLCNSLKSQLQALSGLWVTAAEGTFQDPLLQGRLGMKWSYQVGEYSRGMKIIVPAALNSGPDRDSQEGTAD